MAAMRVSACSEKLAKPRHTLAADADHPEHDLIVRSLGNLWHGLPGRQRRSAERGEGHSAGDRFDERTPRHND